MSAAPEIEVRSRAAFATASQFSSAKIALSASLVLFLSVALRKCAEIKINNITHMTILFGNSNETVQHCEANVIDGWFSLFRSFLVIRSQCSSSLVNSIGIVDSSMFPNEMQGYAKMK